MAISAAQLVVSLTAQGVQQTEAAINRVSGAVDKAAGGFDKMYEVVNKPMTPGVSQVLPDLQAVDKQVDSTSVGFEELNRTIGTTPDTGLEAVTGELQQVDRGARQAEAGFEKFSISAVMGSNRILSALDGISKAMGAIAVIGGITLLAGGAKAAWNQVDAVQQATVALRAYETDARKVDAVLKDLLAFARSDQGKLFMRQELFHAAQAMKVAGAETENLARYTEILSRSVSSGMGNWIELERVIGRVGSTGRITGEDFEMLQKMGFQLDASLRNTTVTWEELFDALDRGSFIIEGQSQTIQGLSMTIRSAIRSIGTEFLGVNSETSMFEAGGLGAKIIEWMQAAPGEISRFASVAGTLGDSIVDVIEIGERFVAFFQMLPGPIQTAVTWLLKAVAAFGAFRVAGKAMGTIGALTGLGGITGLLGGGGGAAGGARGLTTSIGGLIGRINPLGLAIGGVIALGASWVNSFMNQKKAVEDYNQSVSTLTTTLESLRRQGLRDRATQGEGLGGIIDNIDERSLDMMDKWAEGYSDFDDAEMKRFTEFQEVTIKQQEQLNSLLNEALLDPNIDVDAWMSWVTTLLMGAENAEELKAAVDLIIETPLSDFALDGADSMDTLGESMEKVGATAAEVSEIFAGLPARLDDLRIDGLGQQANDIEKLGTAMEAAFKPVLEYQKDRFGQDTGLFTVIDELDATKLETLAGSWERISDALASGDFDNARLMADVMAVISDPSLSMDQRADEIDRIANSLSEYTNAAQGVLDVLGRNGLTSMLGLAGLGGEAVSAAANVNELSASMDTLFRVVVGNTNAIGSQSQALADWASELIGVQGEYSKLDDLVNAGRITGTSGVFDDGSEYANAQKAHNDILASNAEIQEHILVIQAKQAPLLAANADAMADYMGAIADMPVGEQLAALGFMDEGLQSQLGTVIDLAAQMKNLDGGADTFRTMAEGIALTNPALFAMMENVGLVTDVVRNADGTVASFEINLDGADSVQESINSLIESVDALTLALGGIPPVHVDTSEVDTAIAKLGELANMAGQAALAMVNAAMPATYGDTGVPIVTGLPNTGTGTVEVIGDDTSAAAMIDKYTAMDGQTLATMRVWAIADDTSAANMISSYQGREMETLAQMMVWAIADDTSAANMISHYQGLDGSTLASMYVWAIGDASSAQGMINAMSAYNGVTLATTYVDLVTRRIGDNVVGRATGGMVSEDMTLVGELGPELVSLPRGSMVHTNAESMRMMSGGSGKGDDNRTFSVNVSVDARGEDIDEEKVAELASTRTMQALKVFMGEQRAGHGMV